MSEETKQEQLRRLFEELKQTDEMGAPVFDRMWEAARARRAHRLTQARAAWGLAAAALLAMGLWAGYRLLGTGRPGGPQHGGGPPEPTRITAAMQLWEWDSPTEGLLAPPEAAVAVAPEANDKALSRDN
jgi:hypothetical protein